MCKSFYTWSFQCLQPQAAVDAGGSTSSSSAMGMGAVAGVVAMAVAVAVVSTLATYLVVRAWRKRHNLDVFDDETTSMLSTDSSSSSSKLSSVMFRSGTLRTDCPADTMTNPTVNSQRHRRVAHDNHGFMA